MMKSITLYPTAGHDLPPLQVTTDSTYWLLHHDKEKILSSCRGIGALRAEGYDVTPIQGHGVVCAIA